MSKILPLPVSMVSLMRSGRFKQGEMMSILQDGQAQIQGAIDIAMRSVQGERYQPMSTIWQQYQGKMDWQQGTAKMYEVPWTEVTPQNADELLKMRQ